jgi:hypothetical protein
MNMEDQKRTQTVVTDNAAAAVSPADLTALGEKLLAQQRAIREQIPDFVLPHPKRLRLSGPATRVNDVVIKEGLALCETDPLLGHEIDRADVEYGEDYERAFANLRDEMENCYKGLDYSIRSKRYKNGETMLHIMNLGSNLAKSPDHAGLRVGVAAMRKAFHTSRRRETPAPETPAPQPAPTSPAAEQPRAK